MRILYLALNVPVPATNGQAIRTLSLVQALASAGHSVSFVSFVNGDPPVDLTPLSCCHDLTLVPERMRNMSASADYLGRLVALFSRSPYAVERFRSLRMQSKIREAMTQDNFDLIVADSMYTLVNLPPTRVPIVLNCHNVEHVIIDRYARLENNPAKRIYATIEARRLRLSEVRACQRAAVAMACSETDRELLNRLRADRPMFVVPNTVNTELHGEEAEIPDVGRPVLLFQGSMDWHPNRDAVDFFVSAILPAIRKEFPDVRFVVAGRNPASDFVQKFKSVPDVEFTGTVPDMRPFLRSASVVVVPLRLGSGTRIKILEAGAAGKAIVSTRVGAEGLDFVAGEEILLADDPTEFASAVTCLLGDREQRRRMAHAARSKIVERYSHIALRKSVEEVISSIGERLKQSTPFEMAGHIV